MLRSPSQQRPTERLIDQQEYEQQADAYKLLYPAYGTCLGASVARDSSDPVVAQLAMIIPAHVVGRIAGLVDTKTVDIEGLETAGIATDKMEMDGIDVEQGAELKPELGDPTVLPVEPLRKTKLCLLKKAAICKIALFAFYCQPTTPGFYNR